MSSFILGPSTWASDSHSTVPGELMHHLPEGWRVARPSAPSPLDVRAAMVGVLREAGYHATIMELESSRKRPLDDHTDLFERIVRELDVDRYLVYIPRGAQLLGVSWELRGVRDRLRTRTLGIAQVQLFTETGVAGLSERGTYEFYETRNRTRYFQDLFQWGCTPRVWDGYEALRAKMLQAAGEELED